MGRYAQRRRRGGGPIGAAAVLVSLTRTGFSQATALFSIPVTLTSSFAVSGLTAGGQTVTGVTLVAPASVALVFSGAIGAVGSAWAVSAQPSWLVQPTPFPVSGVTI